MRTRVNGGLNSRGSEIFQKSNKPRKRRGLNKQRGAFGSPYLKVRHKIMFFVLISKFIHSFATSI